MVDVAQHTASDYRILVEELSGDVTAWHGDTLLARSRRARVMHETRLPPVVYFPKGDILAGLKPTDGFNTFCPFKGTAFYADVALAETVLKNAAWHYPVSLPDAKAVDGHYAFMPGAATRVLHQGSEIEGLPSGNVSGPIIDWLLREAWQEKTPDSLVAALGRKLVEGGIAVSRITVLIWSLHPMIAGRHMLWTRDDDKVECRYPSYELLESPIFQNSPLRHVAAGLGGIRSKLDTNPDEFKFSILDDLKEQGATDYVAMPLPFSNGLINVMTLASDHPNGFTTANLGLIFECSALISRLFEVFALTSNATSLLETYLGKRTGARVLGGEIRRGDGDEIDAAILFCDLRHSTRMETDLGRDAYLRELNRFFEVTTDIINDHDGEVLKFIGDAVLAIFPSGPDYANACQQALESARKIEQTLAEPEDGGLSLKSAIGIAFGEVTYGNVGSKERLDFTVIGSAANIAARLGDHGKKTGHPIVAAKDVIAAAGGDATSLGPLQLHNVKDDVEAFAVPSNIKAPENGGLEAD